MSRASHLTHVAIDSYWGICPIEHKSENVATGDTIIGFGKSTSDQITLSIP